VVSPGDPAEAAVGPAGPDLSVTAVIVHFRGGDHFDRCVEACLATDRISQVIVVDNEGVGDHLRARFDPLRVDVVEMPRNVGYGTAANAGMARAASPSVLVLNQDVVLPPATLEAMLAVGAEADAWIVAPRLHDVDGVERSRKGGFPPPLRWTPPATSGPDWRPAPFVAGAVMLLTPGHTDLRFDERFFMYGEDEDICFRVWASGGRVVALENAWALHIGATATSAVWSERRTATRTLVARGRFVRKHAGWWGALRWAWGVGGSILRAKGGQAR
jgi:GT2 family glycosyltransferase